MKLSIFSNVRACAGWIDMRDFGAVLDHEEPLPHPACDQAQ
jgi:CRISPR/Cas system type I-B associated protein Csh2 (Cas7 group RAMP superfamily)